MSETFPSILPFRKEDEETRMERYWSQVRREWKMLQDGKYKINTPLFTPNIQRLIYK
jgi:hypothetical protein